LRLEARPVITNAATELIARCFTGTPILLRIIEFTLGADGPFATPYVLELSVGGSFEETEYSGA